ncbi:pantoate--beta-alanine ligase, partial [Candidatus Margulisiibacteriota bacterium]
GCPIVHEPDGLAMSSRNTYLSKKERAAALILSEALNKAKEIVRNTKIPKYPSTQDVINEIKALIEKEPLAKVDYIEIVDTEGLEPVKEVKKGDLIALAVFVGKARLIDNWVVGEK